MSLDPYHSERSTQSLKDDSTSLKAVQKLLINSVGERDYSAQETCHLLLQLPLIQSSRDFTILSLDGSRQVEDRLQDNSHATVASILDHYVHRPTTPIFAEMKLLHFTRNYSMPKDTGSEPKRHKMKVVSTRPYCSPDPNGPQYEQYCQQKLMLHKPFRHLGELKGECDTFAAAYSLFLQSGSVPPSLEDDIRRLEQQDRQQTEDDDTQVCVVLHKLCVQTNKLPPCLYCTYKCCTLILHMELSFHFLRNSTQTTQLQPELQKSGC